MKWLIASDIHGSAFYCRQLLNTYENEKADRMLLLGDILYHGPRNDLPKEYAPKEVIKMLNNMKNEIICVRGNCEAEVDQMVLEFPVLADYAIFNIGKKMMFATHGHKYNEKNLPPLKKGDILLHGHTHIPICVKNENYIYMNPGSVSLPKKNSHNGYMIWENDLFLWKSFNGEIVNEYNINGAAEEYADTNRLLENINKIHTTILGAERVKNNIGLYCEESPDDIVKWCVDRINKSNDIERKGKNWYVTTDTEIITINADNYNIITAHRL